MFQPTNLINKKTCLWYRPQQMSRHWDVFVVKMKIVMQNVSLTLTVNHIAMTVSDKIIEK